MKYFIVVIVILMFTACNQSKKTGENGSYKAPDPEAMIQMNKNMVNDDMAKIEEYVKGNRLEMKKSGTGLYYQLKKDEDGQNAAKGDIVYFSYEIRNLEGELLYTSREDGQKGFKVDKAEIESGWNEAAKLMSPGDEGMFIMPPHLAFRNIGDGDKVGRGEVLVYDLRLDSVERE